jgi:hypothetical protein
MSDEIIMIGLNPSATHEAASLCRQGNKVLFIGNGKTPDTIAWNKKKYNLSSSPKVDEFVNDLGLPSPKKAKLTKLINSLGTNIKDEIGQFIIILSRMEKNNKGPNRLILSGHSVGNYFWGDANGSLLIKNMKNISDIFPKAASLIEDLHLSACYSGSEKDLAAWRGVFPNISTIWAYSGSAPGSYSGATGHLSIWSKATKGNKIALERDLAANTRKGKNVAVWSKHYGYQSKSSTAITDLVSRIVAAEHTYLSFFSGAANVQSPQTGPLRDFYNDLQELIGHPLATPEQLARYRPRIGTTIRLLYFDKSIKKRFARAHAADLDVAYGQLGLPKPSYADLSRKSCLDEINKFEQKANTHSSTAVKKVKDLLIHGLKNLEPDYIPENWI